MQEFDGSMFFPTLNAILNGCAATCLFIGYIFIKKRNLEAHGKVMKAAFLISSVFLASYLWYHFNYPARKFTGEGLIRTVYFVILISHIILATVMTPFVLRLMWLAHKEQFLRHKKLARIIWPVWMYVSVTGVLVYLFLYQWNYSS